MFARFPLLIGLSGTNKTVLVKMILGNGSEGYPLKQGALYRIWPKWWGLEQPPDPSTWSNRRGRGRGRRGRGRGRRGRGRRGRRRCRCRTGGSNHGVCLNQRREHVVGVIV